MSDVQISVTEADVQIAVIDQQNTQLALAAPDETQVSVAVPGVQGPKGEGVPIGGSANQVLFKQSGTNYDTAWGNVTSAMIGDLEIVNADVAAAAAIAGTKISPNFGSQNVVTTGTSTAASFIPTSSTAPTNGLYLSGTNTVGIATNSTGRLFVDASGNVNIGTSLGYSEALGVRGTFVSQVTNVVNRITEAGSVAYWGTVTNHPLAFQTNGQERMRLDASGRLGIGTTSPLCLIDGRGGADGNVMLLRGGSTRQLTFGTTSTNPYINADNGAGLEFQVNGSPRAVIDSSGRLLVGTSTARTNFFNTSFSSLFQVEGANAGNNRSASVVYGEAGAGGPIFILGKHRSNSIGGVTVVTNDDQLGVLSFQGSDGTEFVEGASVRAFVDGTPGANDMPGRLVFSTTADGASSATERMRIDNQGGVFINRTTGAIITSNERLSVVGAGTFQRASGTPLHVNRTTDDGNLLEFYQDTVIEGSISVSGNTVSLNGAHLSRWSQLPKNGDRIQILRGTVLSNLDEMCDWGEQTNEQLNCMKVSDVEGDPNVAGVFQGWDDDDEVHTKDFYCAMTGDMIIRIAEGVTVQRGDLLMSAGDGTAKPQGDDIIRSKTIAKVTSAHITCTYEDGSYCVPCVLMAC